MVPEFSCEADK